MTFRCVVSKGYISSLRNVRFVPCGKPISLCFHPYPFCSSSVATRLDGKRGMPPVLGAIVALRVDRVTFRGGRAFCLFG